MTQWCLKEIEKQAIQYYDLIKCKPENIQLNDYDIIKNSFSLFKSNPYIVEEENDDDGDYIDKDDSFSDKKKDNESEKNITFSQNYVPSDDDKSVKEDITGIVKMKMSENVFKNISTFNKVSNEVENSINNNPCFKDESINNENNNNQKQNNEYDNPNNNINNRKESVKLNDEQNEINLELKNNNQNDDKKLNNDNDNNNGENNKNEIVRKKTLPPSSINDINNNNEKIINPYARRRTLPAGSINNNNDNNKSIYNPYINDIKKDNEENKQIDVKQSSIFLYNTNENNENNEDNKINENYVNNNYFNPLPKNSNNENKESQNKANNFGEIKKNNYIYGNSGLMSTNNSEVCKVSNNVF